MERTSEQLLKWEPFPGLPRDLDTPSLTTDYHNGFHLILAEPRGNGRACTSTIFRVGIHRLRVRCGTT